MHVVEEQVAFQVVAFFFQHNSLDFLALKE
jgi:hypothetical protein